MKPIFQTTRLLLREFNPGDGQLIFDLNSDPAIVKYVHELPAKNINDAIDNLTNRILPQYASYGYGRWAVFEKKSMDFIGWCGLKFRPERNEIDLGYRFKQKYWGKGYATEAARATLEFGFTHYNLPVITAMAHVENLASLKVLEKCGMEFVGFEEVENCPVKTYTRSNPTQKNSYRFTDFH